VTSRCVSVIQLSRSVPVSTRLPYHRPESLQVLEQHVQTTIRSPSAYLVLNHDATTTPPPPSGPRPPHNRVFMIILSPPTLGKTSLDEWSARRRDFYLTTHNTHKRQTHMPLVGFEPAIPASERPQNFSFLKNFKSILRKNTVYSLFSFVKFFNLFFSSQIL
jgi:hypothetical protein